MGTEPRIEALGLALNRMLDRLDSAYSHVSRFSADAAHELRTPLTIIRGELELVAAQARTSSDVDQAIANALEEMTRLSRHRRQPHHACRGWTACGASAPIRSVDLLALATGNHRPDEPDGGGKAYHPDADPAGPPVLVAGDRERLKQVLVNLIDNAIKYTPAGGAVTVQVGVER